MSLQNTLFKYLAGSSGLCWLQYRPAASQTVGICHRLGSSLTGASFNSHHCCLCSLLNWLSLSSPRQITGNWFLIVYRKTSHFLKFTTQLALSLVGSSISSRSVSPLVQQNHSQHTLKPRQPVVFSSLKTKYNWKYEVISLALSLLPRVDNWWNSLSHFISEQPPKWWVILLKISSSNMIRFQCVRPESSDTTMLPASFSWLAWKKKKNNILDLTDGGSSETTSKCCVEKWLNSYFLSTLTNLISET